MRWAELLVAAGVVAGGVVLVAKAKAAPPGLIITGYSIGISPQSILQYGLPSLAAAETAARNYQANSFVPGAPIPPTLYIWSTDSQGTNKLVETVSPPTGSSGNPALLEVFDFNGNRVLTMTFPGGLAAANAYLAAHYTVVGQLGAGGTYDIYDATTIAILGYGFVQSSNPLLMATAPNPAQ